MKNVFSTILVIFIIGFVSCSKPKADDPIITPPVDTTPVVTPVVTRPKTIADYNKVSDGLKDYFKGTDYFYIGGAIEPASVDNPTEVTFMKRHLSSLTCENVMKWSNTEPTQGNFTFASADKIVAFAQANGIKVRGHCLVWHNQVPSWVFVDGANAVTKDVLLERMRAHITAVVNHFKGKVYAWDVVNEAIDDGGSTYKSTNWYNICGEDFIIEAFKAARLADPDVKLFYNDYSETNPTKRDKIYGLLQKLKSQNLVDGVGMQGHWNVDAPSNADITAAFDKYSSLGIDIHVTELDVSVYPNNSDPQVAYTSDTEQKLTTAYSRYFTLFRQYKDKIGCVTFWGLADNHTWLTTFPVTSGRTNYPFLFDTQYVPKQAYFKVIDF